MFFSNTNPVLHFMHSEGFITITSVQNRLQTERKVRRNTTNDLKDFSGRCLFVVQINEMSINFDCSATSAIRTVIARSVVESEAD